MSLSLNISDKRDKLKKALIILFVVLTAMSLLSVFAQNASAGSPASGYNPLENYDDYYDDMEEKSSLIAFAYSIVCIIEQSHPDYNMVNLTSKVVRLDKYKLGGTPILGEGGAMSTAYDVMLPIGMALLVLYFLIEILSDTTMDNFNTEHFVKKLLVLAVCAIVIIEGPNILAGLSGFGDAMLEDTSAAISEALGDGNYTKSWAIYDRAFSDDDGIFSTISLALYAIGVILDNLVFYLLMLVVIMVIYFTALGRALELVIRFLFAPLGIAPLVCGNSPARSAGIRYIKQFASLCLQGAVLVGAVGGAIIIKESLAGADGFGGNPLIDILLPLTLLGLVSRTRHISDDIIGVHGNTL